MIDLTKGRPLIEGEMYVYHVSGDAAYFGTCKLHVYEDCTHLKNWVPAGHRVLRKSGWKQPKTITRDTCAITSYPRMPYWHCKTCLKRFKAENGVSDPDSSAS